MQRLDRPQRRDGEAGIFELVTAIKLRRRQIEQARFVLIDQPAALLGRSPILAGDLQRHIEPRRLPFDHRKRVASLRCDNGRRPALENTGLLIGDLVERIAQKVGMIDRDASDDGRERMIDHIGRVQAAAESDFHQQHVGRMAREQQ